MQLTERFKAVMIHAVPMKHGVTRLPLRQHRRPPRRPWTDALASWLGANLRLSADDAHWCGMQAITLATLGNRPFATGTVMDPRAREEAAQRATAIVRGGFLEALREEAGA